MVDELDSDVVCRNCILHHILISHEETQSRKGSRSKDESEERRKSVVAADTCPRGRASADRRAAPLIQFDEIPRRPALASPRVSSSSRRPAASTLIRQKHPAPEVLAPGNTHPQSAKTTH
jgi:hypothetical protein